MTTSPRRLLLMADSVQAVRRQLGVPEGDPIEPLDPAQLPLSPAVRQLVTEWAAAFVVGSRSGWPDAAAQLASGHRAIEAASAVARELGPEVELRYLGPSGAQASVGPVVAGLFADARNLPALPDDPAGWTAYQSTLILEFGGAYRTSTPRPEPWRTAARTDDTDEALRELRRRAVDPVVASLLTAAELAGAQVVVYREEGSDAISLWLEVFGEEMQAWLWNPEFGDGISDDPVDVAAQLADSMEDWVCETRFAWAQHRLAAYQVPPPR